MTSELEEPQDRTRELALRMGMSALELAELFGVGWVENVVPVDHAVETDPYDGADFPLTPWMIAGEPPQLMMRVLDHGVFLAEPRGRWLGVHPLEYEPSRRQFVSYHELATQGRTVASELVRRRRRRFRYCRFCRRSTPPELRDFPDTCMGCAEAWLGLVH